MVWNRLVFVLYKVRNCMQKRKGKMITFTIRYKTKKKKVLLASSFCAAKFESERGSAEISRTFTHYKTPDFNFDSYQKNPSLGNIFKASSFVNRQLGNNKEKERERAEISNAKNLKEGEKKWVWGFSQKAKWIVLTRRKWKERSGRE